MVVAVAALTTLAFAAKAGKLDFFRSAEQTGDPLYADRRNFYKVEKCIIRPIAGLRLSLDLAQLIPRRQDPSYLTE